ncbi:MAG TPA: type III secretion system export apparatus subunit SctV [Planctomycetota bacterium]|nr:type III secretion system export apparatus subunit SctV [Planctomycetota bacterium]
MAGPSPSGSSFLDKFDMTSLLTKYSDIALAGIVVVVIGMMMVPLPTAVLDVLITANITIGMTILLTALYLTEPVKLSAFPTIILVATMFRLSLEIAATRLILGTGEAGHVIRQFGEFVAGGNLVVGGVVFMIITIVQFLVIAKGSERISEVAARFTLDAMPGKQMSIDADLRAGAFDLDTARQKRRALERESQFYGSMDGAMKFVKGDTIAGLIITAINIIGGLIIGITMHGMSAADAAGTYTILTIGEGLVSQISALLVSTSAGMVTTRVVSEDQAGGNLGKEIGNQLLDQPKALMIAAGFLLTIGLFTPLPLAPFALLGGTVGSIGYAIHRGRSKMATMAAAGGGGAAPGAAGGAKAGEGKDIAMTAHPSPVTLEVSAALTPFVDVEKGKGKEFMELVGLLRRTLYDELGIRAPAVRIRGDAAHLAPGAWGVRIFDVPLFRGTVPEGFGFVADSPSKFALLGVPAQPAVDPRSGREASFVPLDAKERLEQMRLEFFEPDRYLVMELGVAMKRHAADFLGIQEVQSLLDEVTRAIPALVKEVIPKLVPVTSLAEILQRLVQEEISIRDVRGILQSLARWGQVEKDPATLAEYVRSDLKQQISFKFSNGNRELSVYLLDPAIEGAIRSAIQRTAQGSYLALDPDTARKILAAARKTLGNLPATATRPIVLTAVDVRRYLKKLLELDMPQVVVLSYQEISPLLQVQPIGRITMQAAQARAGAYA